LAFNQREEAAHGFEILKADAADGRRDSRTAEAAVDYLRRPHAKPFLLVVSFLGPHDACELARDQNLPCGPIGDPPPLAQCPPTPPNLEIPKNETDGMALLRRSYHATKTFPVGDFSADKWRQFRWGYYRVVERVDAQIDKVLTALREAGLEKSTVVIFTSDHGECAGAHRFNQKTVLYDESARVPLIISYKGRTKGETCDRLVNTGVDILPTMCDFAGLAMPEALIGRSLRPIALGQAENAWRNYVVVQNHMIQGGPVDDMKPTLQGRMVRTGRFKYCVYDYGNQRESLVDMQADVRETKNLARDSEYRDVLLQHRGMLQAFAAKHDDALVDLLLADDVASRPFPMRKDR
jgi:arylsulfatase A-like enzyme